MRIGPLGQAALNIAEKADNKYREAKARLESQLRVELEEKLRLLEWERAKAVRDAHAAIVQESGRPNIAALNRALHTSDHATVKDILAQTEAVKELITEVHPDDMKITKELDKYTFVGDNGTVYKFKIVRGEYVGVPPSEADELDEMNAIQRVAEWEARRA